LIALIVQLVGFPYPTCSKTSINLQKQWYYNKSFSQPRLQRGYRQGARGEVGEEWELRNERRHGEIDVMNITYIHLMVSGSYICMYRRGRIYKKPHGEIQ
jgi:hypothetical protein